MNVSNKILRIKDGKFYYTENDYIDIKDTNIPDGKLSFSSGSDIFWEVELFNYEIETKTIGVRVLDYFLKDISNFYKQKQKNPVNYLQFERFEWSKIEPQLSSYQISKLSGIISGLPSPDIKNNENLEIEENFSSTYTNFIQEPELSGNDVYIELIENQIVQIKEEFSIYYKNAVFKDGYVCVGFRSPIFFKKEEIKIFNSKILPEYHYVKNYFPKYFKNGKKFTIQLTGEVQDGKLISYEATSDEIQSINENVITTVKSLIDIELFEKINTEETEKNIFSIEELIDQSDLDNNIKNSIEKPPIEILHSVLKIKEAKNKKQLEYLAGFKQTVNCQLRFTLKPLFGFLFYIESQKQNHFCWELLNSHATYIWSFDNQYNLAEKLNYIDKIISFIRTNGRKKYKDLVRIEGDENFSFKTLYHKNKFSMKQDGFIAWEIELEKIMNKTSG